MFDKGKNRSFLKRAFVTSGRLLYPLKHIFRHFKTQNAASRFAETLRHNPEGQAGHSYARKTPGSVHPGTIRSGSVHRRSRVRERSRGITSPITAVDNAIDRANASSGSSVDAGSLQPNVGT